MTKTPSNLASTRRTLLRSGAALAPMLMLPRRTFAQAPVHITLLHTNDTHSRIEPFSSGPHAGRGGIVARSVAVRKVRRENPNTFLVDAGDTFQGTPWFNAFKGRVDLELMHRLGYFATCVGNHDFDAGAQQLSDNLKLAPNLSALAANYTVEQRSVLHGQIGANVVAERDGVKIGFFGVGVAFDGLVNPKLHPAIRYTDPRAAIAKQVDALRGQGCALVVALSHLGYMGYRGEVGDTDWPKEIAGVDYVVSGHTHTFLDAPTAITTASGWTTHVLQVGHSGINLGRADFLVDGAGKASIRSGEAIPMRHA